MGQQGHRHHHHQLCNCELLKRRIRPCTISFCRISPLCLPSLFLDTVVGVFREFNWMKQTMGRKLCEAGSGCLPMAPPPISTQLEGGEGSFRQGKGRYAPPFTDRAGGAKKIATGYSLSHSPLLPLLRPFSGGCAPSDRPTDRRRDGRTEEAVLSNSSLIIICLTLAHISSFC